MAKKKNKTLLILGLVIAGLIVIAIIGKSAGWIGKKSGTKVLVEKAGRRTIMETVTANGKIQPETEIKISSDVSGEVRELFVKEGDSVHTGQLLARIDPELYVSALERSTASLNNARANLANSRARLLQAEARFAEIEKAYRRNKKLYEEKLLSDAEMETATSTYQSSKAEVEAGKQSVLGAEFNVKSFEATLKESNKNLTRTEIFAPANGIISKLNIEKGERVVGTSQMAGTEMMRVANLNSMEVSVDVNENDIIKVGLGDTAIVEVDAYGTRKFKGIVTEIANSSTQAGSVGSNDQVTNFVVKVRILRSSYEDLLAKFGKRKAVFRPGMSAMVEIQTEVARDVISVPYEAVTVRNKSELDTSEKKNIGGKTDNKDIVEVVFLFDNDKARICEIKTGVQDGKYYQVLSGIEENAEIISGPYSVVSKLLKPGEQVIKTDKSELFELKEEK